MTLRRLALSFAAVMALGLAAAPALAQIPIDPLDARDARRLDRMEQVMRELRAIVFQGRDSGKPVVIQPAETDYQLQELTRRIADLEQALTRANGQIETSTFELDKVKREAASLRGDNQALTARVMAMEQRPAASEVSAPSEALGPASGQTASEAFTQARQLMLGGDYTAAENAFRDYIDRYDDSARAPEARYWLCKTLSARTANAEAAQAYIGAIRGWPGTAWAPDATVELARTLIALKKPADACQILGEFDRRYPKAVAAVKGRATVARTQAKCAA